MIDPAVVLKLVILRLLPPQLSHGGDLPELLEQHGLAEELGDLGLRAEPGADELEVRAGPVVAPVFFLRERKRERRWKEKENKNFFFRLLFPLSPQVDRDEVDVVARVVARDVLPRLERPAGARRSPVEVSAVSDWIGEVVEAAVLSEEAVLAHRDEVVGVEGPQRRGGVLDEALQRRRAVAGAAAEGRGRLAPGLVDELVGEDRRVVAPGEAFFFSFLVFVF